ncbi:MAG: hypothetical protein F6K21_31345 [Symploca sp. SIO2D2]|nr:hypothetical protein [Symploca sp. SIO2D2]
MQQSIELQFLLDFAENNWVKFTEIFLFAIIGFIIIVDLVLALNGLEGDTISEVIKGWAYERFFVLSWIWGVLAGHFFLVRNTTITGDLHTSIVILLSLTLIFLMIGLAEPLAISFIEPPISSPLASVWLQLTMLILGTIAGHLLWPQSPIPPSI